jgi:hypothetical protein
MFENKIYAKKNIGTETVTAIEWGWSRWAWHVARIEKYVYQIMFVTTPWEETAHCMVFLVHLKSSWSGQEMPRNPFFHPIVRKFNLFYLTFFRSILILFSRLHQRLKWCLFFPWDLPTKFQYALPIATYPASIIPAHVIILIMRDEENTCWSCT